MKTVVKTILSLAALCLTLSATGDEEAVSSALLWMVDDNYVTEVTGQIDPVRVSDLRSRPGGLPVNYARVLAVKNDGSESPPIFLNLFTEDGGSLSDAGTFTDVSEGYAGPLWADVTGYADPSWSFMIELGNLDDSGDDDIWTAMAYSEKATYDDLRRFIQPGEIPDPTMTPWQGGAYAVPEPTSGLLVLIGVELLALKRRKRARV